MDQNERERLKKQYAQYADSQIEDMLSDSPDAFVEGAYALLEAEAKARGISPADEQEPGSAAVEAVPAAGADSLPESFVQIIVINSLEDKQAAGACLDAAGIAYYSAKISVSDKDLPVALEVDQRRMEDAIKELSRVNLSKSITLW